MSRPPRPAVSRPRSRWDTGIEVLAVLGTLTVAGASFSASWHGLGLLAVSVGIPAGQAWVLPVSVDGLQLVASMVILTHQRAGRRARWAWSIVILATVLSAAGNAIAAPRTTLAMTTWGVLPVLLAAAWHLLTGLIEDALSRAADGGTREAGQDSSRDKKRVQDRPPNESKVGRITSTVETSPASRPRVPDRVSPLTMVPRNPPADLARIVHETCDRLTETGRQDITWRDVVDASPLLADPEQGYVRPDRSVTARIRSWERARAIA